MSLRIACISDTHGRKGWTIPPCDVFIHCGDWTAGGSLEETLEFAMFLDASCPARDILLCPGNHDKCTEKHLNLVQSMFDARVQILTDQGCEIDGKRFWASAWTPPFMRWYWMKDEAGLAEVYKSMPGNLDVLITHGPPYGILDPGYKELHVGSKSLLNAVASRTGHIKHHVFGHLHGAGGKSVFNDPYGPYFHNVAAVDEAYNLVRQPFVFEI